MSEKFETYARNLLWSLSKLRPRGRSAEAMSWRDLFAENLKQLLAREGYSVTGMAEKLQVDQPSVSRWKSGEVFPLKYVDEIATYLNVPVERLFADKSAVEMDAAEGLDLLGRFSKVFAEMERLKPYVERFGGQVPREEVLKTEAEVSKSAGKAKRDPKPS